MAAAGEAIQAFAEQREVTPTEVTLRDYDWQRPALDLTCRADAGGGIEVYEYPGRYEDEAVGRRRTRVRLEELRVPAATGRGDATSRRLQPGHVLDLAEHPLDALNRAYLLLEVRQRGRQPEVLGAHRGPRNPMERPDDAPSHQATFSCIPDDVPYRPRRARSRPVALGPQTAVVVGPASEEIHCDEHGRIKVQFHWDRQGARDERSSCWIRVSQAWAGPGWGALYLPRIGQEVVVEFLDGDMDRPMVTGAVYNGMNRPPLDLPQEKSRSTLRSATTPGGAGANELRFEDARDAEEVYLHAQRDLEVRVENDRSGRVGRDERLTVGRDRARSVGGSQMLQVAQDDTSTIGGNQSITVGGNRTTTVGGAHAETIAGAETISVGGARAVNVALASTETVGLAKVVAVGGAYTLTVGGLMSETVGAAKVEEVRGARTEQIGKDRRETVGGDRIVHVEGKLEETVDGARTLKVGKDLAVNVGGAFAQVARKGHTVKAKEIVLSAEETFTVKVGSAIIEVKKGGDVAIKGAKIELKASGDLVLKASKISEN
jgi:type VI secretion system secreted protein VgrG